MKGADVQRIRSALSRAAGVNISLSQFGTVCGLSGLTANRKVRQWEITGPSGPAGVALKYLEQGLENTLPEHIIGRGSDGDLYVLRMRWPRFVIGFDDHGFSDTEWIDDVSELPIDTEAFVKRAIEYVEQTA